MAATFRSLGTPARWATVSCGTGEDEGRDACVRRILNPRHLRRAGAVGASQLLAFPETPLLFHSRHLSSILLPFARVRSPSYGYVNITTESITWFSNATLGVDMWITTTDAALDATVSFIDTMTW